MQDVLPGCGKIANCLLSIIIPCYNSGTFLQSTIDMLESEDVDDCEIIMIDDGSIDDTLEIIKRNQNKYNNIRYISRDNKGVSASRNEGLMAAKGQYVYFLDSDDEITKDTLSWFKRRIKEHLDFDIIAFGYKMMHTDGKEQLYINRQFNECFMENEMCADLFFRGLLFLNICSVLLKREFLMKNNLIFKNGIRIGEDYDFLRKVTLHSKKAYYDKRVCFIYKLRRGSATDGHNRYNLDSYKSLLLSFETAELAKGILEERTIHYFLAARYSAHMQSYLESQYKSKDVNAFFVQNHSCLYKKMNSGRRKVMLAIMVLRVIPVRLILRLRHKN